MSSRTSRIKYVLPVLSCSGAVFDRLFYRCCCCCSCRRVLGWTECSLATRSSSYSEPVLEQRTQPRLVNSYITNDSICSSLKINHWLIVVLFISRVRSQFNCKYLVSTQPWCSPARKCRQTCCVSSTWWRATSCKTKRSTKVSFSPIDQSNKHNEGFCLCHVFYYFNFVFRHLGRCTWRMRQVRFRQKSGDTSTNQGRRSTRSWKGSRRMPHRCPMF